MKKRMLISCLLGLVAMSIWMLSCQSTQPGAENVPVPITQVEVTEPEDTEIFEFTVLNAVSAYLQKSYVKANINGYIQTVGAQVGQPVVAGTTVFRLITKEARAIGNAVNQLDPGFKFSGISNIRAAQSGIISGISHQKGDYVQDGEQLALISNQNSLVFLLDLPYELRTILSQNKSLELELPDGEKLKGFASGALPVIDSASQTQRVIIKVNPSHNIPEGLIAKIRLIKSGRSQVRALPKLAVLANETEDEFWVMKLINDSTAVKVPVATGIQNDRLIEVLKPMLNLKDRIVVVGNYGLGDTARVKVVKKL